MYFKGNEWSSKTFTYIGANNSYPTSSVLNQVVTLSMCAPFFWAYDPHNMNTSPFLFLLSHEMTASVNFSQPLSLWELACPALTVRQAFSSNTPTTARGQCCTIQTQITSTKQYRLHPLCCTWICRVCFVAYFIYNHEWQTPGLQICQL